jgi:hypothetical protein
MLEAINEKNNVRLVVEEAGEELGHYMYIFDLYSKGSKADHLCDNLQQVYYIAKEDYNILPSDFRHISN